jgi:two-component system response regulator VanR
MDTASHECFLNGEIISLTPTEFSILQILLENIGSVISLEKFVQSRMGRRILQQEQ